jgi:hypothetical protein
MWHSILRTASGYETRRDSPPLNLQVNSVGHVPAESRLMASCEPKCTLNAPSPSTDSSVPVTRTPSWKKKKNGAFSQTDSW